MGEFLVIGFVVGILLGIVIQRGSFCMYNAFTNIVITRNYRLIKAVIWAFLATMISFHVLQSLGVIVLNPKPFFWLGSIIGALVFSIGMIWAGSCIVGTPLRAASGKMGYWLTLLGMGIGGWLVIWGPLTAFRKETLQAATKVTIDGANPTLDALFGVNSWLVVFVLALVSIVLLVKLRNKNKDEDEEKEKSSIGNTIFKKLWSPVVIGLSLGVIEVIAYLSGKSPAGLGGFIKGWATYFRAIFTGELPFGWPVAEVTGILVGVFLAAVIAKEFRVIWPKLNQLPRLFFGGTLMGLGAVTAAGGCNVAHIITHMPQLSVGSFVSGLVIIVTTLGLLRIMFK